MRHGSTLLAWLALVLVLSGSVLAQELTGLGERGLYERFCASCHGVEGRGDGPVAEAFTARVPDLTRLAERAGGEFPAERVRLTIDSGAVDAYGPRHMPVWGYVFRVEEGADFEAMEHALEALARIRHRL